MKIKKAIIPAAGLGTRFLPATKALPKEMLPIVDKPAIQYIVEEAIASGIEDIIIITGKGKSVIEDHFSKSKKLEEILKEKKADNLLKIVKDISNLANIHYIRQKEPLGLGHAIYCAKALIGNEPFAVLLGDDIIDSDVPCLKQLIDIYNDYNSTILGVQHVPIDSVSKYGIIDCDNISKRVYKVTDMIEKPSQDDSPSNIAILGRYIITPNIFNILRDTSPGKSNEIQLTDALKQLLVKNSIYACDFVGKRYDVGDKLGYLKATVEFASKDNRLKDSFNDYLKKFAESL